MTPTAEATKNQQDVSYEGETCCQKVAKRLLYRPDYLLVLTIVTIFVAELLVMTVLRYLPPLSDTARAVTDAVILTLTAFPSLYFFVLMPMKLHITQKAVQQCCC